MPEDTPIDKDTGAIPPAILWQEVLARSHDPPIVTVIEPARGHPVEIHDKFGGGTVNHFLRILADYLRRKSGQEAVYRLTANAFGVVGKIELDQNWVFTYRGVQVEMVTRWIRVGDL